MTTAVLSARAVRPRFDGALPRLWFRGERFRTHWYNAYSCLLSDGERILSAMARAHVDRLEDDELRSRVLGWAAQERSHAVQHSRANRLLDEWGMRWRTYLALNSKLNYELISDALGPRMMMSILAGLEHMNAMLGEIGLRDPHYLDGAPPELARLLRWHFAEEIEHRSVAFDLARALGVGPTERRIGGVLAFVLWPLNILATAAWFAAQDGSLLAPATYREAIAFFTSDERFAQLSIEYLREYWALDFHPFQRPIDHLAAPVLAPL